MKKIDFIQQKIQTLETIKSKIKYLKFLGKKIVFTNGCFDILHQGHIYTINQAAQFGDILIVGVNSDNSVKKLKGNDRPIQDEHSRMLIMASQHYIDFVVLFDEETPLELIKTIMPDVLVKGGDYMAEKVVGYKEVTENGGRIEIIPFVEGFSTTGISNKIKAL
jgi:D-beta-D-heptose 7-phosphate kinase/D-beta-D-heptose 1-phosphate adenosyltransferase